MRNFYIKARTNSRNEFGFGGSVVDLDIYMKVTGNVPNGESRKVLTIMGTTITNKKEGGETTTELELQLLFRKVDGMKETKEQNGDITFTIPVIIS